MRKLLLGLLMVCVLAPMAYGADDSCTLREGETLALGKRCTIVSTFTNITAGATWERSIQINGRTARLVAVRLFSTACTNCDVVVADTTCTPTGFACTLPLTSGGAIVYQENAILARTIEGTAYTQYLWDTSFAPIVLTPTEVSGENRAYVRVLNGDGVARTVTVETTVEE